MFGEKSIKNWVTKHISTYVQHNMKKLVPNKSLDIALLFTIYYMQINSFAYSWIFIKTYFRWKVGNI